MSISGNIPKSTKDDYQEPVKEPTKDGRTVTQWQYEIKSMEESGLTRTKAEALIRESNQ